MRLAKFVNFVFKLFLKIFLDNVEFEMMWTSLFCYEFSEVHIKKIRFSNS